MNTKEKIELIKDLEKLHHCFLSEEGAKHYGEPFGIKPELVTLKANPQDFKGLTLKDGMKEATGINAEALSGEIANSLGLSEGKDYPFQHGRGSQHFVCCDAIIKKLEKDLAEKFGGNMAHEEAYGADV